MRKFDKKINKKLGELLIERGVITKGQLEEALKEQRSSLGFIGEIIVSLGFAREEDIVYTLSMQYGFPYLPLENYDIAPEVVKLIPEQVARQYLAVPIDKIGDTLTLVMANPLNPHAIEDIEYITKCRLQIFITTSTDVKSTIDKFYPH